MTQSGSYIMPETDPQAIGPVVVETLRLGRHELRLARPAAPERLLDLGEVADAYDADEYMPYWATLWPVARYLAEVILEEPWARPGMSAIELGCGLGLPGVAALKAGLAVTFSDYDATALKFSAESARLNGLTAAGLVALDWRCPLATRFDVILGSDLIYEARNLAPVIALFEAMLAPGGLVLLADQNRANAESFKEALTRAGFVYKLRAFAGEVPGTVYWIRRP